MRVLLVNRFFHPDTSATSQLLTDLVDGLQEAAEIVVVASRQRHDDPTVRLPRRDSYGRASVFRLGATRFGRNRTWLRALDYLTFHLAVAGFLLRQVRRGDIVVLETDPPLLQLVNTSVVRLKGGRSVNWLQDIYPEIAERLGYFPGPAWPASLLRWWRDRALAAAGTNVVVSEPMRDYLGARGIGNIRVLSNWADERTITPVDTRANRLRTEWGIGERFVVMYSGNLGRAHTFTEITGAMQRLGTRPDIVFVIVGEGSERRDVESFVTSNQLNNVKFLPRQPRENLSESLGAADVHLVSLKPGMENLVMPSKLYGILAAGRPVIFIGDAGSAIAGLVTDEDVGAATGHGDAAGLASAIERMADGREIGIRQGNHARAVFERRFTRSRSIEAWRGLLAAVNR